VKRVKAPRCFMCHEKPAKPRLGCFCSRACAADYGLEKGGLWTYCPTCEAWAEWGTGDAWHEAQHATIVEHGGKWTIKPGEEVEGD
jgi:hypothetical protein